jgi:hypothetical protein
MLGGGFLTPEQIEQRRLDSLERARAVIKGEAGKQPTTEEILLREAQRLDVQLTIKHEREE